MVVASRNRQAASITNRVTLDLLSSAANPFSLRAELRRNTTAGSVDSVNLERGERKSPAIPSQVCRVAEPAFSRVAL